MMAAQCWSVPLDVPPETLVSLAATLSADERDRSERLRFDRDRRRFIVAHGVLRDLLGRYLGRDPGQIRFVCNAFGKPELHPEFGGRLRFNLSHSADLALIAIAEDADVGVDVEYIRPQPAYLEIARSFFSATEVAELNRLPSPLQTQAFFRLWTKKEAYGKARGVGLAMSATDPAEPWSLDTIQPAPGYIGALAIERTGASWGFGLYSGPWSSIRHSVSPPTTLPLPS